ncbi:MAG: response regulator [Anaerolineae bacterium]|nr:response regulator [Anaerolineae bacterium]
MEPTVLMIEDDAEGARLMKRTLGPRGYRVLVASDGLQGLEMAHADPPDLILLDLLLPGMDGLEILSRLRTDPQTADVPVVVISSSDQPTDQHTAAEIGADAYLIKPYGLAELLALLRSLLSERSEL